MNTGRLPCRQESAQRTLAGLSGALGLSVRIPPNELKPDLWDVLPVARKLANKHFQIKHPTTAGGDGEQREPLHPCPVGLQGR